MASAVVILLGNLFLGVVCISDCVKPWQEVLTTKATVLRPAAPMICHPESKPCPREAECAFSLRSFKYVCCSDREDTPPPACPKYHDTLAVLCSPDESTCPRGYLCLPAQQSPLHICCKPNPNKTYPEPETTFIEHKLVPFVLPFPPQHPLQIEIGGRNLSQGELVEATHLNELESAPTRMWTTHASKHDLYTILVIDVSADPPEHIDWALVDVEADENGTMDLHSGKQLLPYRAPARERLPVGTHILVTAVWRQKSKWANDNDQTARLVALNLPIDLRNPITLHPQPLAGTFYGFSTRYTSDYDEEMIPE